MRSVALMLGLLLVAGISSGVSAQAPENTPGQDWPGEPVDNHVYLTWATLTADVSDWAEDYPEIVDVTSAGQTELGKDLWVVRLSDWSNDTKADGSAKEKVYIDGGHHGNEHLGTALAWVAAKWYIQEWDAGNEEAIRVLQNTELHILIMLNADGNDINSRWNINQVDLNRNYDHHWNEQDETQPGSGPFSEAETLANSIYMNTVVPDADLYVTMHTGVWIILHPWGYIPDQPVDWELFHFIRDDVNANISDIPIRNADQGLYPNSGTSRDYGYGIMGFPTFTFETDDEQWLPGSAEPVPDRLAEEFDVMRYLIDNVWYWRAQLQIDTFEISETTIDLSVKNHGRATSGNATLQFLSPSGEVIWDSPSFTVNATNKTTLSFAGQAQTLGEGTWNLNYQVRVIDSARWVNESVNISPSLISSEDDGFFLDGSGVFDPSTVIMSILCLAVIGRRSKREEFQIEESS